MGELDAAIDVAIIIVLLAILFAIHHFTQSSPAAMATANQMNNVASCTTTLSPSCVNDTVQHFTNFTG